MAFPIKKRINTELFIDRTAAVHMLETWIRHGTIEGDQPVILANLRIENTLH